MNDKMLHCPFCGATESERDGVVGTQHKEDCYIILMETELPNSPLRIMAWNARHEKKSIEIIHQQQPDDMSCSHTCIAMLLGIPTSEVIKRIKTFDGGMNTQELYRSLDHCKFTWNALIFNRLCANGFYLSTVPSLNTQGGAHAVLLELTDDKILIHDPQKGREGKRFYGEGGCPLKYFSELVFVIRNGFLPNEVINL